MNFQKIFFAGKQFLIVVPILFALTVSAQEAGSVNFGNSSMSLVTNADTGLSAKADDGIKAALYWSPVGSQNFVQIGAPADVGIPVDGIFAGGTRLATNPANGSYTVGGGSAQFLVRAWNGGFATFEDAAYSGVSSLGQSAIVTMQTGGGTIPPSPPASLMANGLNGFALNNGAPEIISQPLSHTNLAGSLVTFNVIATGSPMPGYQWRKGGSNLSNGGKLSGATTSSLTLSGIRTVDAGGYDVVVTNIAGSATSLVATLTVVCPAIMFAPTNFPSGNQGTSYTQTLSADDGTAPYTFTVTGNLPPGLSLSSSGEIFGTPTTFGDFNFAIQATDANGCTGSAGYSINIGCPAVTLAPATLPDIVFDPDAVFHDFYLESVSAVLPDSIVLASPFSFSITAGALPYGLSLERGFLPFGSTNVVRFATIFGMPVSNGTFNFTITVTDTNGCFGSRVYTINVLRPLHHIGKYYGLFSDPNAVAHQSAGFFQMKVGKPNGTNPGTSPFSGKLYVEGEILPFAGSYNSETGEGALSKPIARKGRSALTMTVQVGVKNGSDQITGTLSDDSWAATMLGDRLIWNKRTNPPTAFIGADGRGRYNIVIPGSANAATEPGGDAYQLAVLKKNGVISSKGAGSDFLRPMMKTVSAGLSKNGTWPFFAAVYPYYRTNSNGAGFRETEGEVMGWLTLTNNMVVGDLIWIKTFWTNGFYDGGFTNMTAVVGSDYVKPASGDPILSATSGSLIIADGNVPEPLTNSWNLYAGRKLVSTNGSAQTVKLRIAPGSGELPVWSFRNPATPTRVTKGKAVVLQRQSEIRGVFLGTNQSGSFRLRGN